MKGLEKTWVMKNQERCGKKGPWTNIYTDHWIRSYQTQSRSGKANFATPREEKNSHPFVNSATQTKMKHQNAFIGNARGGQKSEKSPRLLKRDLKKLNTQWPKHAVLNSDRRTICTRKQKWSECNGWWCWNTKDAATLSAVYFCHTNFVLSYVKVVLDIIRKLQPTLKTW